VKGVIAALLSRGERGEGRETDHSVGIKGTFCSITLTKKRKVSTTMGGASELVTVKKKQFMHYKDERDGKRGHRGSKGGPGPRTSEREATTSGNPGGEGVEHKGGGRFLSEGIEGQLTKGNHFCWLEEKGGRKRKEEGLAGKNPKKDVWKIVRKDYPPKKTPQIQKGGPRSV